MNRKTIFLGLLTFSSLAAFSQTKEEAGKIISNYNLVVLDTLAKHFNNKYIADQAKIREYVAANPGTEKIALKNGGFAQLVKFTADGHPLYYSIDNTDAAKSTRTNFMHGFLGLNTEGQNMTMGVWDGGPARVAHQEFTPTTGAGSRVTIGDASSLNSNSFHGTHVSGTIAGRGVGAANARARGMAPQGRIVSFDWSNDMSEMTTRAGAGLLISNHSYGTPMYNNNNVFQVPDWYPGCYSSDARSQDILSYNAPYYLIVNSAGNEGNLNNIAPLQINFDKLNGDKAAKNNLTVANANDASVNAISGALNIPVSINSSSSQGPADDRRVKPDITGNGTTLYSCVDTNNTSYDILSGTSMAAPNVSGSLLLLQQYYNSQFGTFMRAATLKGLACHTADDSGNAGPDPIFGWGLLNMKAASDAITNKLSNTAIIDERTLANQATYQFNISTGTAGKLIASITWTDVPGVSQDGALNSTTPALVNDLDIRIIKDGTTYLPWKLNPSNVAVALRDDNAVDNVERVEIDNAPAGTYTIVVSHKNALYNNANQDYSLVVTGLSMTLGNDGFDYNKGIAVYPNPASSELNYTLADNIADVDNVSVFDATGKTVNVSVNSVSKVINISALSSGIYFVRFDVGNQSVTKKFIKN